MQTVAAAPPQTILFSEAKKELFSPSSGFRSLQVAPPPHQLELISPSQARLKAHWSVGVIRDEITMEKVGGAAMIVFGCPRDKFSVAEVTVINYGERMEGLCALVLSSEEVSGGRRESADNAERGRRDQTRH